MSATEKFSAGENSYAAWKETLVQTDAAAGPAAWDESAHRGPLSFEEMGLELKGLGTLLLVGLGLLAASGLFLLLNANHLSRGEQTTGVVIGHKERYHRRSGRSHAPVVEYVVAGEVYRIVGRASAAKKMYPVHQEVTVLYLPDDPGDAVISDFMQLYLASTILGTLGALVLAGAGGLSVHVFRKSGWRLLPG
jgi:hypothetical protein